MLFVTGRGAVENNRRTPLKQLHKRLFLRWLYYRFQLISRQHQLYFIHVFAPSERLVIKLYDFLLIIDQPTVDPNLLRSNAFVSGEHPYSDAGITEIFDSFFGIFLHKVFDTSGAQDSQVAFNILSD